MHDYKGLACKMPTKHWHSVGKICLLEWTWTCLHSMDLAPSAQPVLLAKTLLHLHSNGDMHVAGMHLTVAAIC